MTAAFDRSDAPLVEGPLEARGRRFAVLIDAGGVVTRKPGSDLPYHARPAHRLLTALIGLALVGVGLHALLASAAEPALRIAGGLGFLLTGADMLWSARRGTECWLAKLGPLP